MTSVKAGRAALYFEGDNERSLLGRREAQGNGGFDFGHEVVLTGEATVLPSSRPGQRGDFLGSSRRTSRTPEN